MLGGHNYYRANPKEGQHWRDLWKGWKQKKTKWKSENRRENKKHTESTKGESHSGGGSSGGGSGGGGGGGGGGRDSSRPYDQGISGQYVKPTPIETPEPPQLTKIGKQTWDLEL